MPMTDAALSAAREKTVRDHMALEITHDWDAVIATFDHPRYELVGTDTVFDGEDAVRAYFKASRTPFPDQGNEIIALHQSADAIVAEFWLTGTHTGPLKTPKGEVAPTGKGFRVRMCACARCSSSHRGRTGLCASGCILIRGRY
jgi:hypothetical protein